MGSLLRIATNSMNQIAKCAYEAGILYEASIRNSQEH